MSLNFIFVSESCIDFKRFDILFSLGCFNLGLDSMVVTSGIMSLLCFGAGPWSLAFSKRLSFSRT